MAHYGRFRFIFPNKKLIDKKVRVSSMSELVDRAKQEWHNNIELRKKAIDYALKHHPYAKRITIHLGFWHDVNNPHRYQKSISLWKD